MSVLTVDLEVSRHFLVSSPVGELSLVVARVLGGDSFDDQVVDSIVLSDDEMAVLGVDASAIFGPFAHGLGIAVTRNGNGVLISLESLHIVDVVTRGLS